MKKELRKLGKDLQFRFGHDDTDGASITVERVTSMVLEGSLDPDELLSFFRADHSLFSNYLQVLATTHQPSTPELVQRLVIREPDVHTLIEEVRTWIRQEDVAMNAHFENFKGDNPFTMDFFVKPIDVTHFKLVIDIVTDTPSIESMLWERREFETTEPEILMMGIVGVSPNLGEIFHMGESYNPIQPIDHPLAIYHPERAKVTRTFIKKGYITPSSLTGDDEGKGQRRLVVEMGDILSYLPLKYRARDDSGKISFLTRNELQLGYYHHQFVAKGRQIFDINKNLTAMFKETDVNDVPVSQINTPYPAFYVHFGRQEDMPLTEGWHVEGAYVMHMPEHKILQMMITCVPDQLEQSWYWPQDPDPCYFLTIGEDLYDKTFGEALTESYEKKRTSLQNEIDHPIPDRMQMVPDEMGGQKKVVVASNSHKRAMVEKQMIEAFHEVADKALRLVVNSLCYLSSYPEEIERVWPGMPKHVQANVRDKAKGNKKKMESLLEKMGYRPLHFCGLKFVQENAVTIGNCEAGRRQHWRRGHWRNQPYGEGRQNYRLRWIQPMLVNKENDSKLLGGLYLTD